MNVEDLILITLIVTGFIAIYAVGLYFNKETPLPKECESPISKCESCSSTTCSYSDHFNLENIKKEISDHD